MTPRFRFLIDVYQTRHTSTPALFSSLTSGSQVLSRCFHRRGVDSHVCNKAFSSSSTAFSPHFDSHQFVSRLEKEGLSREQAEALMVAIEDVIDESMKNLTTGLMTRSEMEKQQYTQRVDFAKLKSEIQLVEKQDFALLKSENERLLSELERLKQRLREEITRTQASVRLDLNLEKGRIRDELGIRELKIREVDTRIEGEIGNLRTTMESVKFNMFVSSLSGLALLNRKITPSSRTLSVCSTSLELWLLVVPCYWLIFACFGSLHTSPRSKATASHYYLHPLYTYLEPCEFSWPFQKALYYKTIVQ